MGSNSSSTTDSNNSYNQNSQSQNVLDPAFRRQYLQYLNNYNSNLSDLLANPVNTSFSTTPDAIVRSMVSQGVQNIKDQSNAANRSLAMSLNTAGGNNTALLAALQRQGQISNAGAANALVPAALQAQRENDLARISAEQNARTQQLNTLNSGLPLINSLAQMAQAAGTQYQRQSGNQQSHSHTSTHSGYF